MKIAQQLYEDKLHRKVFLNTKYSGCTIIYLKGSCPDYRVIFMNILQKTGGLLIFFSSLILLLLSHSYPSFAVWYGSYVFPIFPHTLGRFFGLFSFSVFEIIVIALPLLCLIIAALIIKNLCSSLGRKKLKAGYKIILVRLSYALSLIFLIFVLSAGINYNRESYAYHIGINLQNPYLGELEQLYLLLISRAEQLSSEIKTNEEGHFQLRRDGLYDYAIESMYNLNNRYGGLGTAFPRAKAPFLSRIALSNFNISGFFSPWTMEAHYNGDMPAAYIPFVINHELAHVAGHMREDEANFIAYLASRDSQQTDFQYSAVYMALNYTLNALQTSVSRERYIELYNLLPHQLRRDFAYSRAYWQAFEGRAADIATRTNDAYLRFNQQEDGVESYGRMLDLLLAYYRNQGEL